MSKLPAAAALLGAALLAGCVVAPAPYAPAYYPSGYIAVAPPAPRIEYVGVAPAPGYFWIAGTWSWIGARYVWRPGHWQAPRAGYQWVPQRWEGHGERWRERPGHWQRR